MALIEQSELSILRSADEAKTVADSAREELEKSSVAYAINTAANTGEHSTVFSHPISDVILEVLRGQGYKVTRDVSSVSDQYKIEGF